MIIPLVDLKSQYLSIKNEVDAAIDQVIRQNAFIGGKFAEKFEDKFAKFSEHWSPKIIAQMNDYHFKLVKFQGDFVWHNHTETDEVFIVLEGEMGIEFRDGKVTLNAGEMFVVPGEVEHKPFAEKECKILLIEPAGTVNTGDAGGDLTAEDLIWI